MPRACAGRDETVLFVAFFSRAGMFEERFRPTGVKKSRLYVHAPLRGVFDVLEGEAERPLARVAVAVLAEGHDLVPAVPLERIVCDFVVQDRSVAHGARHWTVPLTTFLPNWPLHLVSPKSPTCHNQ